MFTIESLTAFFGWCSVINIALLIITALFIFLARKPIANMHSEMFGIDKEQLYAIYFQYMGHYKIAILIFNIVPFIALKFMS